jgi:AraC family transcriptional activator of pobA
MNDANFPIESLGNIKVSLSQIRVETIADRLVPRVPFPHKHDFFHIVVVMTGSGWHEIDFKRHQVYDGSVFIVKPGQVHAWNLSPDIQGYIIEFYRESLDANVPISTDLTNQILVSKDAIVMKEDELSQLTCNSDEMYSEILQEKDLYDISLQAYLTGVLVDLVRVLGNDHPNKFISQGLAENFQQLVNIFFHEQHGVSFYAKKLGVTNKALTAILKRKRRKTPRQIIQERFLLEAKRLLSYSHLSIAEIGYKIGFEDSNYFSRFFRMQVGMTPAEFRHKIKTS